MKKLIITVEVDTDEADNFEDACYDCETAVKETIEQYGYTCKTNWKSE